MKNQQLQLLAQNAQNICEQLERGQAETPLSDAIGGLINNMQQPQLTVALLGLTPDSIERVFSWLYGDAFKGFSVTSKQLPGFMEVTFSEGYAFGLRKKHKQQFDQQEAFVQALQIELGATRASVANPFALQAPSSRGLKDLRLLIPDTTASLLDSPALLNAIIAETSVALVAAPLRYTFSREDHDAVDALLSNMQCFMPLLTVDELHEEAGLPDVGWWEQHKTPPQTLAPTLITTHVQARLPGMFTDPASPDRKALLERFQARKLAAKLDAIFERYQQEAGVLEQRKARFANAANNADSETLDRAALDKIRQSLDDGIITLRKELDSQTQQLALQQSPMVTAVNQAIEQLQFENLSTELSHSVIKLRLDEQTLQNLRSILLTEARTAVSGFHQQLDKQLQSLRTSLNQQLEALAIPGLPQFQLANAQTLNTALDQRLEVTLNYRGEMPKRTVMTRLGESRKLIMGLSMATMVIGGVAKAGWGIDLRQSVMLFAPIILIGGFIYTFIQWPKEDAEKLEKELDRVRDSLKNESRRVVSDVQRFIAQQLFDLLETQKREFQKGLQHTLQKHQDSQRDKASEEKQKQQQATQQIDQELQQWQGTQRQLERLRADVQGLLRAMTA
ncbi:hypothetical protein MWU49_14470 [Alcanivorax sp. S6407]|uniref:hypothetical protein n=1 Tax=Alcanivorax sp. S6407 TaxID=2926424 RepID=UPI001FF3C6AB|nr:hypothetical protein [Alcanivorax sp. S6407]MCK0154917.1 hypothetical protein [Alcanivorax sp. S6407]